MKPTPQAAPIARRFVPLAEVKPDPEQPRQEFDAVKLAELAASFYGRPEGILQDLLVRREPGGKQYVIVDGERRWRAAQLAKLDQVPIRLCAPANVLQMQLVCALQRENLSALEEAAAAQRLLEQRRGQEATYSVARLGEELGRQRANMYEVLALNRISPAVRARLEKGELSASAARLFALVTPDQQAALLKAFAQGTRYGHELGVRGLRELIERDFSRSLKDAPWPLDAPALGGAPPCTTCPRRSANIEGWAGGPQTCTDVGCYGKKQAAWGKQVFAEAQAKGEPVLDRAAYRKMESSAGKAQEKVWSDPQLRTWGQLAEGIVKPKLTVADDGTALWVFTPADLVVIKKARKLGFGASRSDAAGKAKQASATRRRAALSAALRAAAPRILEKLALAGGVDTRVWQPLAAAVLKRLAYDEQPLAAEYLAVPRGGDEHIKLRAAVAKAPPPVCVRFVVAMLLLSEADNGDYQKPDWNPLFLAAAKLAGVPLKIQNVKIQNVKIQNEKGKREPKSQVPSPKSQV